MKYIYGPLKSRRLGLSLGISLTPYKICSFDCIYCQLGKTSYKTQDRSEYVLISEIIEELKLWLFNNITKKESLEFITMSGSGEPSLNSRMGDLIIQIKGLAHKPVAVITNASLMNLSGMRKELAHADLVIPSLDAANQDVFNKIDRPAAGIKVQDILDGLIAFRKEYTGQIWLEIMLIKGSNDSSAHIKLLQEAIERIKPDRIQLNSPVRVTTETNLACVEQKKLEEIKEIFGDRCEII
ncbi:MAG: radical SAM protein [Candidatus Omnitrophota bacterium]